MIKMKTKVFMLSMATVLMMAACTGTHDPEDNDPSGVTGPFTLSVDKAEIESDGYFPEDAYMNNNESKDAIKKEIM